MKEKVEIALKLTNFINTHLEMFKSMYRLFKTGKTDIEVDGLICEMESTNFNEIKQPEDKFLTTILLMYLSMKLEENHQKGISIDQPVMINEEEFEHVYTFSEYLKTLNWYKELEENT